VPPGVRRRARQAEVSATTARRPIKEATSGSFTYSVVCAGAPPAAKAETEVEFTEPTVTVNGSGGSTGKSGGRELDLASVALLVLLMCWRERQRHTQRLRRKEVC
jgi:hypothetical protein